MPTKAHALCVITKDLSAPRVITCRLSTEQCGNDSPVLAELNVWVGYYFAAAMPRYELALILKQMQRPETAAALRRTVETLMERGALVRDLENLGERQLPYRMTKHNQRHSRGTYFLVDFYAAPSMLASVLDHLHRDVDVVRPTVLKKDAQVPNSNCCGPQKWLNVRLNEWRRCLKSLVLRVKQSAVLSPQLSVTCVYFWAVKYEILCFIGHLTPLEKWQSEAQLSS